MSRAEYRPIPPEATDDFLDVTTYAFRPEAGPDPDYEDVDIAAHPGDAYGMYVGDELRSVCRHYWLTTTLRDTERTVAGLSAVATPPEYRRRGYVAEMLRASLEHYRERGVELSALWPFKTPFYRRFGWGVCDTFARVTCSPDDLRGVGPVEGRFERVDEDDWTDLRAVDVAFADRYERMIGLDERWYRHRVFDWWGETPYVYVYYRGDAPRGYLTYRIEHDEERAMQIHHLRFADHEAFRALIQYCHVHEDHLDSVRFPCPDDVPVLDVLDDPHEVEVRRVSGSMYRVVDVRRLLDGHPSPIEARGPVVVEVTDPLAPWNDGRIAIGASAGELSCRPTDAASDVRCDIATLTRLITGHRGAEDLVTLGELSVDDDAALESLDAMFPPRCGTLLEWF
ncbi:MAG: GNAT family N-acetyltransferase [Halobacteriota archaeon]